MTAPWDYCVVDTVTPNLGLDGRRLVRVGFLHVHTGEPLTVLLDEDQALTLRQQIADALEVPDVDDPDL